ncbi:MAG TPA: hypothetical protein VJV74_00860, partial [Terriglobia bacterium]|nr:hypothetical protein [Terriglobia bacterium]
PHNLNASFGGIDGEALLVGLNDVALSLGSACMSASREPSYVLKALGVADDLAQSGVRFGLGRFNTQEEVDYVVQRVVEVVTSLRDVALDGSRPCHPERSEGSRSASSLRDSSSLRSSE